MTAPLGHIDLEAIRARADAATKGPWRWAGNVDFDDPRLVGRGGDVLGHIPRERQRTDRAAEQYASYLRELSVRDVLTGGWRSYTEEEIEEHVEADWLTDPWGEPVKDERMAFYGEPGPFYHDARDLAVFAVCPEATDRNDPRVYRADIIGLRNPNAEFIAHARQDVDDLLVEIQRLKTQVDELECEKRPRPELMDGAGMKWTWHPAGYLREDDGETLTAEQIVKDFEAVAVA